VTSRTQHVAERVTSGESEQRRPRPVVLPWVVLGCYLLGAVALTTKLWADPAGVEQRGDLSDVDLFAWFMRYAATAVSHGHLPALITGELNAPYGVNLMWNTSFLLPGIVLSPVTLLFGPQVSLTVVLTLGFAGSAAALFWVLRRWGASVWAAALGGAVYGFSPALLVAGNGHYHLQFAVLPPLIVDAVLRLITSRGRAVRTGIWLGLMCAAQIFISEELLVYTLITVVIAVVVLAASRPGAVLERARGAASGLATAAVLFLVLDGYALWRQFKGPYAEHSKLQVTWGSKLAWFVVPSGQMLFHTYASSMEAIKTLLLPAEYVSYLGFPLILVLLVAGVMFWRDIRVRAGMVTWLVLEAFALGGANLRVAGFTWPGRLLPWHYLQGLPGLAQVLPWRFSILADGAAAVVLVFALDRALATQRTRGWQRPALAAIAVLAVLPLMPLPYQTIPVVPLPVGWQATFTDLHLPDDAPVLVLPMSMAGESYAMRWQAATGDPGAMIGGYYLGPNASGQVGFTFSVRDTQTKVERYLNDLWLGYRNDHWFLGQRFVPSPELIRTELGALHTAAIVVPARPGWPIASLLTRVYGQPTFNVGGVLSWRLNG
jgi:hypothetical protein